MHFFCNLILNLREQEGSGDDFSFEKYKDEFEEITQDCQNILSMVLGKYREEMYALTKREVKQVQASESSGEALDIDAIERQAGIWEWDFFANVWIWHFDSGADPPGPDLIPACAPGAPPIAYSICW